LRYISEFMPEFRKIKFSLENDKLIMIIGDIGTGKTGFVNDYLETLDNTLIERIDVNTPKTIVSIILRSKNMLYKDKIVIYDDETIKKDILNLLSKSNYKIIVIINKLKGFLPKNWTIHKTRYPKTSEIRIFLKSNGITDKKLINNILKLKSMRQIQYAIEDKHVYYICPDEKEKFDFTNNPYILSMYIAENEDNLRKLKRLIVKGDKLKFINDYFYSDFIKCFYPRIEKKRLRYPKLLFELVKIK